MAIQHAHRLSRRRFMALICSAVLALGLTCGLAGCADQGQKETQSPTPTESTATTRSFTDSAGRTVEIPTKIDRIASSGPLAQQVLLTIAPDKMVGLSVKITDEQAKYLGNTYASMPIFGQIYGGKGDFNKEAVAAADPQLIIDIGEAKPTIAEDMDALQEQTGIPCVHIESSLSTYDEAYKTLGDLLGESEAAEQLASYCKDAYESTKAGLANVSDSERVRGAYLLGDAGLNAIAQGSFQGTVVDMTLDNVVVVDKASGSGMGNEISMEQLSVWNPDFIVFGANSVYSDVATDSTWQGISAIAQKKYCEAPGLPYNWLSGPPSVNQILGMQYLPRVVYPEAFNDDLKERIVTYYKLFYHYDLTDAEYDILMERAIPLQ